MMAKNPVNAVLANLRGTLQLFLFCSSGGPRRGRHLLCLFLLNAFGEWSWLILHGVLFFVLLLLLRRRTLPSFIGLRVIWMRSANGGVPKLRINLFQVAVIMMASSLSYFSSVLLLVMPSDPPVHMFFFFLFLIVEWLHELIMV
jgi:hypothetical protein